MSSAPRSAPSLPRSPQRSTPSVRTTTLLRFCCTMARAPSASSVPPPASSGMRASASDPETCIPNQTIAAPGSTIISTARMRPNSVAGCVATISPSGACSSSIANPSARFAGALLRSREQVLLHRDQPELFRDWGEASPMENAGAKALQCVEVFRSRIALVVGEPIPGVLAVELRHQAIAVHLGDDARGADGDALRIALDDGLLRHGESVELAGIDQEMLRLWDEGEHGALEREQPGPVDVDGIDLLHLGASDSHRERAGADLRLECVALLRCEQLGVVDALDARARRQDHGGPDHRAREGCHPHFVAACHQRDALLPERQLEG